MEFRNRRLITTAEIQRIREELRASKTRARQELDRLKGLILAATAWESARDEEAPPSRSKASREHHARPSPRDVWKD